MRLLLCVLEDSSTWCRTSTTRDWLTITRRVEHEGESFLTITLPTFCQAFERGLEEGGLTPDMFPSFHAKKHTSLPAFLHGLTSQVFDPGTGYLLEKPDVHAIYAVRQIALLFKKVLLPCSKEREDAAFDGFIQCESEVLRDLGDISPDKLSAFLGVSRLLWGSVLSKLNRKVVLGELVPRHGPGATAERISGNRKFEIRRWHERLQPFFPADSFAIANLGWLSELDNVDFCEPEAEIPVRVITVPKTLKTPRIIAIEPVCMQYTQQSILIPLVESLESHKLTKGLLNFTDQTVNQRLARSASQNGRLSTIDLKDASDRVSVKLVELMLECLPDLRDAILACRSTTADVPGRGIHTLAKFASMGSALCFPIEAMVFYTIVVSSIHRSLGTRLTPRSLFNVTRRVRIYGDDIIIPVDYVQTVMSELEAFGLRVNRHKSFFTGKFRESCGVDAYDGVPVTPVYCRRPLPTSRRDSSEMISAISLRNQFYRAGYWRTTQYLTTYLERLAPLPYVADTSPVHGLWSYTNSYESQRMCPNLHTPLVKGVVTKVRHRSSMLDGHGALLKALIKRGEEPYFDPKHLERHGRPESVDIKIGWYRPF